MHKSMTPRGKREGSNVCNSHPLILMSWKRRRLSSCCNSMDSDKARLKLAAVSEALGRQIRVFKTSLSSENEAPATSTSQNDVPDEFYDFTSEDYYRIIANKMGAQFLKTRKIREAEAEARRSRITKAVIRVRFSDGYVIEAKFQPMETVQSLIDLLSKVVARPDLPFYIYTTPPKQRVTDLIKDFYSAGFAPGAIVYFAYDLPKDAAITEANSLPFLRDEIISLSDLDALPEKLDTVPDEPEPTTVDVTPAAPVVESKPINKPAVPKWFKW